MKRWLYLYMKQNSFNFQSPIRSVNMTTLEKSQQFATLLAVTLQLQEALNALAAGEVAETEEQNIAHLIVSFVETTYQPAEA